MGVARHAPLRSDGHTQKSPKRSILCDLTVKLFECCPSDQVDLGLEFLGKKNNHGINFVLDGKII